MNIGGTGTISKLKKKSKRLKPDIDESSNNANLTRKEQSQIILLEELKNKTKNKDVGNLSFQNYPILGWGIGVLMIISGLFLIYHISLGKYGSLFEEFREGYIIESY